MNHNNKMKKEPLYKKWWAWIIVFLISAVIINHIENLETSTNVDTDANDEDVIPVTVRPPTPEPPINDGTFVVGTDLKAGEYFIIANENRLGYVLLTRERDLVVDTIIWQRHFENHTFVTVQDGEFLTIKNATLIHSDNAVVPGFNEGRLNGGTYRVGKDIPAGIYTLFPTEDQEGYFFIATSSRHVDAHIINRQNFAEPIAVLLNDGEYLTFLRAEIRK